MINVGIIGIGYWGPNIIRNFYSNPNTKVVKCCDLRKERLDFIGRTYPAIETSTDYNDLVKDQNLDLIAICTPVYSTKLLKRFLWKVKMCSLKNQ